MKHEPIKKDYVKIVDHGFKEPEIKEEDYHYLGATKIPDEIIREDGQYLDFLPEEELQRKSIETYGCTGFGTLNGKSVIQRVKYGKEENDSDRCINILANNTPNGNNPQNPAEALRKIGVCSEEDLPYTWDIKTWKEFHSPDPLPEDLLKKCADWKSKYEFLHEWVSNKPQHLMSALKRSPLGVSVMAWKYRNGKYYKDSGDKDDHWCLLVGYKENDYWLIFDSYDSFVKKLEWNYTFSYVKKYYLKKKQLEIPEADARMWKTIKGKTAKEIYAVSPAFPNKIRWIADKDGSAWKDYIEMVKDGYILPYETVEDSVLMGYEKLGGVFNIDYYFQQDINRPFGFWKWITSLLKK